MKKLSRADRLWAEKQQKLARKNAPQGPRPEPVYGKRSPGMHRLWDNALNGAELAAWDIANAWTLEDFVTVRGFLAAR